MTSFRSIILITLLIGQAAAFMNTQKSVKAVGPLASYNRNYDSVGGYGNDRYNDGMRRYNEYDRRGNYNNQYGDHRRGGYDRSYDRGGYNAYYDRGMSRSKYGDWLNGSSNYIPTSADRNYVMDRGYETNGGRYNNYHNNRYNGGYERYGPYNNRYSSDMDYGYGGRNGMQRYSPVAYNNNFNRNSYGSYNRDYDRSYDRTFRSSEYERTHRSPMDSHRQEYPSYTMGRMEDQFGYKKWWDSN